MGRALIAEQKFTGYGNNQIRGSAMKKAFFRLFCLFFVCLINMPLACPADGQWKLAKDKKGVQVYTRPMPGSDILEFKARAMINAPIEVVATVLSDIENFPEWMSKCKKTSIVEKRSNGALLIKFVQTLPWPVANRDVILLTSTVLNEETGLMEVYMESVEKSEIPPMEDLVRMTGFKGKIILENKGKNKTEMTFILWADPGGSLPARGVNGGTLNIPFRSLIGMKKMVKKKKYIKAAEKSIFKNKLSALK